MVMTRFLQAPDKGIMSFAAIMSIMDLMGCYVVLLCVITTSRWHLKYQNAEKERPAGRRAGWGVRACV